MLWSLFFCPKEGGHGYFSALAGEPRGLSVLLGLRQPLF